MDEEPKILDLGKKLAQKNPSFVRDLVESHFISFEASFKEGKLIKCEISKKNYKEK